MTRKLFLIAGVAGMALTSPAMARPDHQNRAERSQPSRQASAKRQQRVERAQIQRSNARQASQRMELRQRQSAQRMESRQRQSAQRMESRQRQSAQRAQLQRSNARQAAQRSEMRQRQSAQRLEMRQRQSVNRAQTERRLAARQQLQQRKAVAAHERNQRVAERRVEQARDRQMANRMRFEKAQNQRIARQNLADRRIASSERSRVLSGLTGRDVRFTNTPRGLPHVLGRHDMRPMSASYRDRVRLGERIRADSFSAVPLRYRTRYADNPTYYYRYDNDLGYVYRVNRSNNLISSLVPVFGGYNVGDPWPNMYRSSYVPTAYQPYYYDTPDYYYRYDGNAIYRINAQSQLISGIVALLTGNRMGVGQMLPSSYNVYNVPMAYRSSYYDTPDNWYRYGDGYIYQVDPYSRRISASYPLYGGYDDYAIGQRWPVAYPDYNVPYGYQNAYYDTPQYQYRYANGAIYQVDPTTQLISAIAALVSGQPLSIGQQMPSQYGVYNVPMAYRDRYYDTPNDWYRYADGYVYRVNPNTGLIQDSYSIYA